MLWLGIVIGLIFGILLSWVTVRLHYAGDVVTYTTEDGWSKVRLVIKDDSILDARWLYFRRRNKIEEFNGPSDDRS